MTDWYPHGIEPVEGEELQKLLGKLDTDDIRRELENAEEEYNEPYRITGWHEDEISTVTLSYRSRSTEQLDTQILNLTVRLDDDQYSIDVEESDQYINVADTQLVV
jgi:hypothetical protein